MTCQISFPWCPLHITLPHCKECRSNDKHWQVHLELKALISTAAQLLKSLLSISVYLPRGTWSRSASVCWLGANLPHVTMEGITNRCQHISLPFVICLNTAGQDVIISCVVLGKKIEPFPAVYMFSVLPSPLTHLWFNGLAVSAYVRGWFL